MLNGLYKAEYGVNDAFGRSIMCMHNGKLLGGNSAFAHLGTYQESGDEIVGEVITQRHNDDPLLQAADGHRRRRHQRAGQAARQQDSL